MLSRNTERDRGRAQDSARSHVKPLQGRIGCSSRPKKLLRATGNAARGRDWSRLDVQQNGPERALWHERFAEEAKNAGLTAFSVQQSEACDLLKNVPALLLGVMPVPSCSPIFVIGSARSGTTLLQLMLNAHPRLSIIGELHFFSQIRGLRRLVPTLAGSDDIDRVFELLPRTYGLKYLAGVDGFDEVLRTARYKLKTSEAPSYEMLYKLLITGFAERKGAVRSGEKSTNLSCLEDLVGIFPGCKIIHTVRDPRANVASRLKVRWASDDVITNAIKWRMGISSVQRFARQGHGEDLLEIRYEDLVTDPVGTLQIICDFLDQDFDHGMLDYYQSAGRFVDSEPWKHGTLNPVYRSAMQAWRHELSPNQIWLVELITRRTMQHYGYETACLDWRGALPSAPQAFREMSRWIAFKVREHRAPRDEMVFSTRAELFQMLWRMVTRR